jgi:hypothetical protein
MTEQGDAGGRSREEEVLRARRGSLERLGDRAFAISLLDALGVDQPVATSALRDRFASLPPDRKEGETVAVAGRGAAVVVRGGPVAQGLLDGASQGHDLTSRLHLGA